MAHLSDIEIARRAEMRPIDEIAERIGLEPEGIEHYGRYKAKIGFDQIAGLGDAPAGKLVLVSAITPTPAGEGKTTTTIGLGDALNRIGKKTVVCLREPSLGPCFGMKGGAAGGGYAQVVPMEDINLHFTGDFHAIGLANNLLAAALDNHIHHGNALGIDPRRVVWKRVVDMNDRALRHITVGLGGPGNSVPREDGYDITVASEVMAIFCLAQSPAELKERLGRIVVAYTYGREPVRAADLKVHGAMTVLLKDALKPNLVQTLEHTPALVHGGPFANIAHGCNSVIATKLGMRLGDYAVTEAGFGADLGAEKFLNIKCRKAGIAPDAVVLVATIRALKLHGGVTLEELHKPEVGAVERGVENLRRHIENIHQFHLPVVVAVNRFTADTDEEIACVQDKCDYLHVKVICADHWARGGAGAEDLAHAVVEVAEHHKTDFKLLYEDELPLWRKVRAIAQKIYGADDILGDKKLRDKFKALEEQGYGDLPICMAKTQYSLSTDPALKNRPTGFEVPLRDVRLAAGAGFIVVLTGDIMTMPGLPKVPAAESIDIDEDGNVVGLFQMPLKLLKFALSKAYPEPRMFRSPERLKDAYDVVIIGGGGHGLAAAYYLATEHGITDVAVIEKGYIGSGGTGRNTAIIRSNYLTEEGANFYQASVDLFRDLSRSLDLNLFYSQRGHFTLAHSPASLNTQRWRAEMNKHLGIDSETVGPAFIKKKVPEIDLTCGGHQPPIHGALYHPPGAIARHDAVAWGYARGADRRGAEVHQQTAVTDIEVRDGAVAGVHTSKGYIKTKKVLSAVAGWTTHIQKMIGLRTPLVVYPLQAFVTEPLKPWLDSIVVSASLHTYVSQSSRGELVSGASLDPYELISTRSSLEFAEGLAGHLMDLFPFLGDVKILRQWAGLCDMTPDFSPIMGTTPLGGFYIDAGWGTWGFKATPISGFAMAHTVATGSDHPLIEAFNLSRFARFAQVGEKGAASVGH